MKKLLLLFFVALTMTGCSTPPKMMEMHFSPLQLPPGHQQLFLFENDQDAFTSAYGVFGWGPIPPYPAKGYQIRFRRQGSALFFPSTAIDVYIFRIYAAMGTDVEGQFRYGYYPELTGRGPVDEESSMANFYADVLEAMGKDGELVLVDRLIRVE